jgi:hypothetical protein
VENLPDEWAEIIFHQLCTAHLVFPERPPLPDPDEVSITDELARLWRESHA